MREHISFQLICVYFFFEYVRPQQIIPAIDILPWAQLAIMGAGLTWLTDNKRQVEKSPVFFLIIALNIVVVLSAVTAQFPGWSWSQIHHSYNWVVIYFLTVSIVNTRQRLFFLVLIFLVASFKLSLHGTRTFASRGFAFTEWGLKGPPGFFENSGELAMQMLIFAPMMWFFAQAMKPHLGKWMYRFFMFAAATGVITIIGSSSRGGQLALAIQLIIVFLIGRFSMKSMLAVVFVGLTALFLLPEKQLERFTTAGEDKTSQSRLLYWEHGWEMMKNYPAFGVGFDGFRFYHAKYYSSATESLTKRPEVAHNSFVQVGTGTGFTGLFIFTLLVILGFTNSRKIRKNVGERDGVACFDAALSRGFSAGLWGFLVAGQFISAAFYPFIWIQLALIMSLKNITDRSISKEKRLARQKKHEAAHISAHS